MDENLQKIVDKYSKMIYKIAFDYLKKDSDAEDVVQEVLIKYILNEKEFKDENHEKNWIIRVTINYSHNLKKSGWNKYTVPINDKDLTLEDDTQCELYDSLSLLQDKYKDVIQLFYYQDLPIKAISKILKITEDNVKTRLKRGREKMRDIIKGDEL